MVGDAVPPTTAATMVGMAARHARVRTEPVFVDSSGRRSRLVARTCWALGALGVAYVGLIVVSLLLPPGLSRLAVPGLGPVLPGPAAAPLGAAEGEPGGPEVLLAPERPRPSDTGAEPGRSAPADAASSRATGSPAPPLPPVPPSPPAAAATTPAGATPPGQQPSGAPARTAPARTAPPGQVGRSPRPRPSNDRGPR
ncbi:MAG: hypothetical protein WD794_01050 [Mycobacteriales bacterium]